ncbi:uncharacterized protein LOC110978027 [Acanthaster planci]|uniref:Uncharacterized protein LOC110978027 n=1 Tax=Acanthaster planci TaxID=133434 RepID=A0A8B7Y573_ACAPL|nr:uncharacterized protein LOC110978027 [Acanthaster planci]
MAKKNRSRTPVNKASLDPAPMAEPAVGDLPDAASENASEPCMPEAAKEVPGMSSTALSADETLEASCTEDKPTVTDDSDSNDTVELKEDEATSGDQAKGGSQASIPEEAEKSLDHDTQELDEEGGLPQNKPQVEEVQDQERKRPLEGAENDEGSAAKKVMSEVSANTPGKTVGCEE